MSMDEPYRTVIEQMEDEQKKQREEIGVMMRGVLRDPDGRMFLVRLLRDLCNIYGAAAPAPNAEPQFYLHEGRRQVGVFVKQWIEQAEPNAYHQLMLEADKN